MLPRVGKYARTTDAYQRQMRTRAATKATNTALLNSLIDLFVDNAPLYWVNIHNPDGFIDELAQLFDRNQVPTTRQLAVMLYRHQKSNSNQIEFEHVNDPLFGLSTTDTDNDSMWKAAHRLSEKIVQIKNPGVFPPPVNPIRDYIASFAAGGIAAARVERWESIQAILKKLNILEQINFVRKLRGLNPQVLQAGGGVEFREVPRVLDQSNPEYAAYLAHIKKVQKLNRNLSKKDREIFSAIENLGKAPRTDALERELDRIYAGIRANIGVAGPSILTQAQWRDLLDQILTVPTSLDYLADIPPAHQGRTVSSGPIKQIRVDNLTDKWSLLADGERLDMAQARAVSPKSGGANNPGSEGCIAVWVYERGDEHRHPSFQSQRIFFKQPIDDGEINYLEIISEVTGARIMHAVAPLNTAAVCYAVRPNKTHNGLDQDVYIASLYFDGFMDINRLRTYPGPEVPRNPLMDAAFRGDIQNTYRQLVFGTFALPPAAGGRGLAAGDKLQGLGPVKGLGKGIAANLLVGNRQFHIGNNGIGKTNNPLQPYEFKFIDIGGALRNQFKRGKRQKGQPFSRAVHPHTVSGAKNAIAYIKDIPLDVRLSKGFIEEVNEVARANQEHLIAETKAAIDDAKRNFSLEVFRRHFAEELGIDEQVLINAGPDYNSLVKVVKDFLVDRIVARQFSLREYALELRISGIVDPQQLAGIPLLHRPQTNPAQFETLVRNSRFYFARKRFHFRRQPTLTQAARAAFDQKVDAVLANNPDIVQKFLARDLDLIRYPNLSDAKASENVSSQNVKSLELAKVKNSATLMQARMDFVDTVFDKLEFDDKLLNDAGQQVLRSDLKRISSRLQFALHSKQYDFSNEDDMGVVIQMCDEAANQMEKLLCSLPADKQQALIDLMTIPGNTQIPGAQLEYLQKVVALTERARALSREDAVEPLMERIETDKLLAEELTLGKTLVDEMIGIDRSTAGRDAEQVKADAYATFKAIRANLSLTEQKDLILMIQAAAQFPETLSAQQVAELVSAFNNYARNVKHEIHKEALKSKISELYAILDTKLTVYQDANSSALWAAIFDQMLTVPLQDPAFMYRGEKEDSGRVLNGIPPRLQGRNLAKQAFKIKETTLDDNATCLQIRDQLDKDMSHYRWVATKGSGFAGKNTPYGGWQIWFYRNNTGKICVRRELVKQDDRAKNHDQNLGEVVISCAMSSVAGNETASVASVVAPFDPSTTDDDARYICSIGYPKFEPVYIVAMKAMGATTFPDEHAKVININIWSEAGRMFRPGILRAWQAGKLPGLTDGLARFLLIDNRDSHGDNMSTSNGDVVILDHGSASSKLSRTVHPNKQGLRDLEAVLNRKPGNHFTDYPLAVRVSKEMAASLEKVASVSREELSSGFDKGLAEVAGYTDKAFFAYAEYVGIKFTGKEPRATMLATLKKELLAIHVARQYSLKEYALEIRLSRCFKDARFINTAEWANPQSEKEFAELVKQNPAYFLRGFNKGYHIRGLGNIEKIVDGVKQYVFDKVELSESYKKFIYEHAVKTLNTEEFKSGVRDFLSDDLDNYRTPKSNKKTHAVSERMIKRLELFIKLMDASPERDKLVIIKDDLIDARNHFTSYKSKSKLHALVDSESEDRKKLLVQVCDRAFTEMATIYDLMPEDAKKAKIYEIFNKISYATVTAKRSSQDQSQELQVALTNPDDYIRIHSISVSNSKMVQAIDAEVERQITNLHRATDANEIEVIKGRLAEAKDKMDAVVRTTALDAKLAALQTKITDTETEADAQNAAVEEEKREVVATQNGDAPFVVEPTYAARRTNDNTLLKPIPIESIYVTNDRTAVQAAQVKFGQVATRPLIANPVVLRGDNQRAVGFAAGTAVTFCHDPTDKNNYAHPGKPSSGFVESREFKKRGDGSEARGLSEESNITVQEYAQADEHRLTYRIAKNLLQMKFTEDDNEYNFLRLKRTTGNAAQDILETERILAQCLKRGNLSPRLFTSGKLTDEAAKKLFEQLKSRDDVVLTRGVFSGIATPKTLKTVLEKSATSEAFGFPNLEPPELLAYAKVWAARIVNVIKRPGAVQNNGLFAGIQQYDPRKVSISGSTDVNFSLVRSILLAVAATYGFNAKQLKQVQLGYHVKHNIVVLDHESRENDERDLKGKLVITDKDIRDARDAYTNEKNKLHAAIQEYTILPAVQPANLLIP